MTMPMPSCSSRELEREKEEEEEEEGEGEGEGGMGGLRERYGDLVWGKKVNWNRSSNRSGSGSDRASY